MRFTAGSKLNERLRPYARWHPGRRATLAEVRQLGDVALLRYALSPRFRGEPLEEV